MRHFLVPAVVGSIFASPAAAEVKSQSETGFVIGHSAEVLAKPDDLWKRLIAPKEWWSPAHSWFGKADGFYIDAQAGGCFCETASEKAADGQTRVRGSVEHMRVIFADRGKVLRMQGALGPLQSEAVLGTLTVAMEPTKDGMGTRLSFAYVVGGYMRYKTAEIAPAVDKVLAEQFASLIKPFGKPAAADTKADAAKKEGDWSLDPATLEEKPTDQAKPGVDKPKPKPTPGDEKPVSEKPKATVEDKAAVADKPKTAPAPKPAKDDQ